MFINGRLDKDLRYIYIHTYTHTHTYIQNGKLAIKKNKVMPLAIMSIDLEIVILNEVSQTEKDKYHNGYM